MREETAKPLLFIADNTQAPTPFNRDQPPPAPPAALYGNAVAQMTRFLHRPQESINQRRQTTKREHKMQTNQCRSQHGCAKKSTAREGSGGRLLVAGLPDSEENYIYAIAL